jgi:hypothetical protein
MDEPTNIRIYGVQTYGVIKAYEEETFNFYGWFDSLEELRKFCENKSYIFEGVYVHD